MMEIFVARQPIFDRDQNVYAYELLYRDGMKNAFFHKDADGASSKVIVDSLLIMDMKTITGGNPAFINMTYNILVNQWVSMLPSDTVIVEILEDVEPDNRIVNACTNLKRDGFKIVLDDFIYNEKFDPLLELADIIKVDFVETDKATRKELIEKFKPLGIEFLAEKVETKEEFDEALDLGYDYFQGYFFGQPHIVQGKNIPPQHLHYVQLLKEVQQEKPDFRNFEKIIKRDLSLSYKLLKYINSAYFGLKIKVKSIFHALNLLGMREVRKWVSLVFVANMSTDKPEALVVQSIIRAKMCEFVAKLLGLVNRTDDFFLMGMFSLIDAILSMPKEKVFSEIPIADDIKGAMLGETNLPGTVLNYVIAYERGDWDYTQQLAEELGLDQTKIPELYAEAVQWGDQSVSDARAQENS